MSKPLSALKVGQTGKVAAISQNAGILKKRLLDMGCVVGSEVSVVKLAPLGDPIEISVKNYNLTLRKSEADNILVEA
jgi:ferrous iron transport protein A